MKVWITLLLVVIPASLLAQKQMVMIRHDEVVARFKEGDYVKVKLKNGQKKEGAIVELNEFDMVTTSDTILFTKIWTIRNIETKRSFSSGIGGLLFVGGVMYFTIDRLNSAFGYNPAPIDPTVVKTSAILAGSGLTLILLNPRAAKAKPGTSIRTIDYTSVFYK